jgi:hypothetical protein
MFLSCVQWQFGKKGNCNPMIFQGAQNLDNKVSFSVDVAQSTYFKTIQPKEENTLNSPNADFRCNKTQIPLYEENAS